MQKTYSIDQACNKKTNDVFVGFFFELYSGILKKCDSNPQGIRARWQGHQARQFSVICAMSTNLARFGRRKFVSTSALAEIFQEVKSLLVCQRQYPRTASRGLGRRIWLTWPTNLALWLFILSLSVKTQKEHLWAQCIFPS